MIKIHQWKDYKLKRMEKRNHVLGHVNNFEQKKTGKRLRKIPAPKKKYLWRDAWVH